MKPSNSRLHHYLQEGQPGTYCGGPTTGHTACITRCQNDPTSCWNRPIQPHIYHFDCN